MARLGTAHSHLAIEPHLWRPRDATHSVEIEALVVRPAGRVGYAKVPKEPVASPLLSSIFLNWGPWLLLIGLTNLLILWSHTPLVFSPKPALSHFFLHYQEAKTFKNMF